MFLVIYTLPLLKTTTLIIDFKINQEFIAKVLCINKDKPELKCNGQCHLKKELSKSEEKEKEAPQSIQLKEQMQFTPKSIRTSLQLFPCAVQSSYPYMMPFSGAQFFKDIFHPPRFV